MTGGNKNNTTDSNSASVPLDGSSNHGTYRTSSGTLINFTSGYSDKPKKNGTFCIMCKAELYDTHPDVILTSHPAQKNTHCADCGFIGYRTV